MNIRSFLPEDLPDLIDLTIATFGASYEVSFASVVGESIFSHQHGDWREDDREQVSALNDPASGKYVAVAVAAGLRVGCVGCEVDAARRHGEIDILAVSAEDRRRHVGAALCDHAVADMKVRDVEVVAIGTGGDWFHAPARALSESLGFTPFPGVVYVKAI